MFSCLNCQSDYLYPDFLKNLSPMLEIKPQNTQKQNAQNKKTVALLFGGRSPEHDVSIVSGLQALNALDVTRYDAFPVYVTLDGEWLVGDVLRERGNYMLSAENRKKAQSV